MSDAYFLYYILEIVLIPGIILGIIAEKKVLSAYKKYNSIKTKRGKTGAEVARSILNESGNFETKIQEIPGKLTDQYDPKADTISLSKNVANNSSISSVGIAAHEVGHVMQHKQKYFPVKLRSALVPVLNFSNYLVWPFIIIGLIFEIAYTTTWATYFIYIGLCLYSLSTIFCLVTLPVELNASKRAYKTLIATNELTEEEANGAKKVLNAAAWTYVAGLITSILSLLRVVIFIFSLRGKD